ncbi:Autophagy protein 22, partial [Blyttiomyces sp. JEL0837]
RRADIFSNIIIPALAFLPTSGSIKRIMSASSTPYRPPARPLSMDDHSLNLENHPDHPSSLAVSTPQQDGDIILPNLSSSSNTNTSSSTTAVTTLQRSSVSEIEIQATEGSVTDDMDDSIIQVPSSSATPIPASTNGNTSSSNTLTSASAANALWVPFSSNRRKSERSRRGSVPGSVATTADASQADSSTPMFGRASSTTPSIHHRQPNRSRGMGAWFGFSKSRSSTDKDSNGGVGGNDGGDDVEKDKKNNNEEEPLVFKIPTHAEIDNEFPGEEHPPLSKEELRSFYIYSWSAEAIVIIVFASLVPLVLQNLAVGHGYDLDDHSKPCNYTAEKIRCQVDIFGAGVDPASFAFYSTALSVGLQAFLFISLGAVADHGAWRKRFMIGFMVVCALSCMGFVAIRDNSQFLVASLLYIIAGVTFGASYVFYDAYIPLLTRSHWEVMASRSRSEEVQFHTVDRVYNTLSTYSSIVGYMGAILCFGIVGSIILPLQSYKKTLGSVAVGGFYDSLGVEVYAMQLGIAFAGLWGLVGMYWPLRYMRVRPGSPLPKGKNYFFYSWSKVFHTVKRAKKLPNTFLLLMAWFLLSDAMTTVGSVTILFAQNELGFASSELIVLAIGAPIVAAGGNFFWLRFQ